MTTTQHQQPTYTHVRASLVVQPWRVLDPDEPTRGALVYSVHVEDPSAEPSRRRIATLELLALRTPASSAMWLLWADLNDGVTPEYTEWHVPNIERPFDTRRENGAATDVLLAFVVPTLDQYMRRVAPHLATPTTPRVRQAFDVALKQWHTSVRDD